jgi:putative nucleotidyltransferase with HDIG domain
VSFLGRLQGRLSDWLERFFAVRWIWAVLFLVFLAPLMLPPGGGPVLPVPEVGSVVPDDVLAPTGLEFSDDAATREVREAARNAVLPVYDLDSRVAAGAAETIERLFAEGRRAEAAGSGAKGPRAPSEVVRSLRETSGVRAPQPAIAYLAVARFDPEVEARAQNVLREVYRRRIVGSRTLLPGPERVTLRDTGTGREWKADQLEDVLSLDEARRLALETARSIGSPSREIAALGPLLTDLVSPDLAFNGALTEARRQEAAARVEPLIVRVPRGKVLLRAGEVVTEEAVRTLLAFNRARAAGSPAKVLLANLLFMGLLLFFMSRYVLLYQQSYTRQQHLFALMVVVTVLSLSIDQGFVWLYDRVGDTLMVGLRPEASLHLAMMPVAVGAILITLLIQARVGMVYALFYLPLFGMMTGWDLPLLLFGLISNLAAIYGITTYHQRTALIKAGIVLGAINALAVLAILSAAGRTGPAAQLLAQMLSGFLGGILVAVLVSFLLPLLEMAFNILTDIRLLELSNLNNPLLRRLAVEAPGSYNHSVIVGSLAEAAAEAIGANALFCRVAAYYHDVGKMLKPDYFIENQRDSSNRHDRLTPHMSALVIASHVKEGYELAKSYGLPRQVLDIIPQHHGTRKINFFYQKAKREEQPEAEEVLEADYRYPGPKPQTREAAIFMLSDSIEAAARTLEDPSPARFKGLIRKIISDVVLDDQFSECDLSFADLDRVSASFLRTLSSIYHHRIDYPGFDFDKVSERPFSASRTHEETPPRLKGWGR